MKIILIIIIGIVIINYSFKYKQVEKTKEPHYVKIETQNTPKEYLTKYAPQVFDTSLFTSIHSIYNQVILPIGGFVAITAGLMCLDILKQSNTGNKSTT